VAKLSQARKDFNRVKRENEARVILGISGPGDGLGGDFSGGVRFNPIDPWVPIPAPILPDPRGPMFFPDNGSGITVEEGIRIGQGIVDQFPGLFPGGPTTLIPSGCTPPLVMDTNQRCVFPGSPGDVSVNGTAGGGGQVVMGRYGAAMAPAAEAVVVRRCLPGQVLGKDNNCYEHLTRKERKWPKPRKPLGTTGELNAVDRATRVSKRVKSNNKKLKKLGLL